MKIKSVIYILTIQFFLFNGLSFADKANYDQSNSKKVYVLNNRDVTFQKDEIKTINSVKKNNLDFIIANSFSKDSLVIKKSDSLEFLSEISKMKGNWLVFVHGDAKTFEQSILRGLAIKEQYNINVLIFTWPSKDLSLHGVKNLKKSQQHVNESLVHFFNVLKFVQIFKDANPSFLEEQKISLLFHSLGNQYMKKMIENDLQKELPKDLFDNIILNAAAVNQKTHKEWVEKINIQKHIFITSNKHDFNLKGLRIFTSENKQLGEKITSALAKNAHYVSFDKSVGFRLKTGQTHTYFIGKITTESSNIKNFYSCIFNGKQPDFNDDNKYLLTKDNISYEIIYKTKKTVSDDKKL